MQRKNGLTLIGLLVGCICFGQKFQNESRVRSEGGKVNLYINGEQTVPFAYMSYLGEGRYFSEMGNAGIGLFCLLAYMGDLGINSSSGIKPFRPSFWKGRGEYDFAVIQKEFETLVNVKPDAKVIVRVHLDAPIWWGDENPDEMCLLPDGQKLRVSFSSKKWRHDAGVALNALLDWISTSRFNENLVGIHVAGGFTEEWFFHYREYFYDESKARLRDYRHWLREKYQNDEKLLQRSWQQLGQTFANAVPSDISGRAKGVGWRKKGSNPQLDDTLEYHGQLMADHVNHFSQLVKKASDNRLLTGAFYGYHLFVHDSRRGHGSLERLLSSPYLDYLSSPNDYRREVGIDWLPMAAVKSVQLHGKLWMAENDTRTFATTLLRERAPQLVPDNDAYDKGVWKGPADPVLSKHLLWKNAGRMLAYGYGGWWFDMWGGWFSDPELMEVIARLNAAYELYAMEPEEKKESGYRPEVAVVVDEKLQFSDASYGSETAKILSNRYALGNSGAPFDIYLRGDLPQLKAEKYKVIWYLGLAELTDAERRTIDALKKQTEVSIATVGNGSSVFQKGSVSAKLEGRIKWSPEELRALLSKAGVHIFSTGNDVVYAGNGWLTIHFKDPGKREILLPEKWLLIDMIEDSEPLIANRMELEGDAGETIVFRVEE